MAALTTTDLRMKLFIDTKSERVLFAEAGKDVVDFLFSLLHLPLATAVTLVGTAFLTGSAGSLHTSAEFEALFRKSAYAPPVAAKDPTVSVVSPAANLLLMPASSFEPSRVLFRCKNDYAGYGGVTRIKDCRLYMTDVEGTRCPNCSNPMRATLHHVSSFDPRCRWPGVCTDRIPPSPAIRRRQAPTTAPLSSMSSEPSRIYFRCVYQYSASKRGGCKFYMADVKGTACPNCGNPMTDALYYVSPAWSGGHSSNPTQSSSGGGGGEVQDQEAAVTYTVLDDLDITRNDPTSAVSAATRLRGFGITDLGAIEEKTVWINYIKGLKILNALLHSKTVLTDVFLFKARA